MHKERIPNGLQKRIYSFSFFTCLIIAFATILLGTVTIQNAKNYQVLLSQLMDVRQFKTDISKLSEMMQNNVISDEGNSAECLASWQELTQSVEGFDDFQTEQLALLADDLKQYQTYTNKTFYDLIQGRDAQQIEENYQIFLNQQDNRIFMCNLLIDQLNTEIARDYPSIANSNQTYLTIFIVTLIGMLFLTVFFSYSLAKDVSKPVQKLVDQAGIMMLGNYEVNDLPVLRDDEIGYLTTAFNEMKHKIQANFQNQQEVWQLKSYLQDAEYRALQSQVNPHFLFNVLSVATEEALIEGADGTVDVIEKISYMLHYSLTSVRENALLDDEVRMVQAYFFLQEQRFGSRITFRFAQSQNIPQIKIPGMTLQPIVENAVLHGVEKMISGGEIDVSMDIQGDYVIFCVKDNGCGIPEDMVDSLNTGKNLRPSGSSSGLGVANVRGRLERFYQEKDLLWIESKLGEGTRVFVKYPLKEGENDVPGHDR